MSAQVFTAMTFVCLAVLLAASSCVEWKRGRVRNLDSSEDPVERDREPLKFWLYWALWMLLAVVVAVVAVKEAWLAVAAPDPSPATNDQLWAAGLTAAIVAAYLLWSRGRTLWRRGPPWRGDLRRERELRKLISTLADDPFTGIEGETIDQFARYADLEWLEEIVAHLSTQSAPRSLIAAIEATDPPAEEDAPERTIDRQALEP
jgi:hypothetical protein